VGPLDRDIRKALASGLATRYDVLLKVAKKYIPEHVEQWGKLRRLEGGDIMHAHDIVSKRMDGRDATFIRVRDLNCCMFSESNPVLSWPNSMNNSSIETGAIGGVP
jgi:hypothetical protein